MPAIDLPPELPSAPIEVSVTAERIHIIDGEPLGLVGLHYQRQWGANWSGGLSVFGAGTGTRDGFFAWGAEGAYRRSWGRWRAETGLFVGGGGGGPAWVGGGLMLRPHVELSAALGDGWRVGVGASRVRFPHGLVDSTQHYVAVRWSGDRLFGAGDGAPAVPWDAAGAVRAADSEIGPVLGIYRPTRPPGLGGVGALNDLQYGGFVYRRSHGMQPLLGAQPYVGLMTLGAIGGGYDGYGEFTGLAGLQWRSARWPSLSARLEAAMGVGGAGDTADSGGGALVKASAGLVWQPTQDVSVAASLGQLRSRGPFAAKEARVELSWRFRDVLPAASDTVTGTQVLPTTVTWAPWTVATGWAHYDRVLRNNGSTPALGLVTLTLERRFGPHWRLVTRANTAASGYAGGYATGHVGLGWLSDPLLGLPLHLGWEASVGAAGGGQVQVDGGLIGQAQMRVRYAFARDWALELDAGQFRGLRGSLSSPFLGLSLVSSFSTPQAR